MFILIKNTLAELLNIFIIQHHEKNLTLNQASIPENAISDPIFPPLQTDAKSVWYPQLIFILHCLTKVTPMLLFGRLLAFFLFLWFLWLLPDMLILQE